MARPGLGLTLPHLAVVALDKSLAQPWAGAERGDGEATAPDPQRVRALLVGELPGALLKLIPPKPYCMGGPRSGTDGVWEAGVEISQPAPRLTSFR